MTHAGVILKAVASLVGSSAAGATVFSRAEVRHHAGLSREDWNASYSPIFQGMRRDQPGGAPKVGARYTGVFEQVSHGRHRLTEYGRRLVNQIRG